MLAATVRNGQNSLGFRRMKPEECECTAYIGFLTFLTPHLSVRAPAILWFVCFSARAIELAGDGLCESFLMKLIQCHAWVPGSSHTFNLVPLSSALSTSWEQLSISPHISGPKVIRVFI